MSPDGKQLAFLRLAGDGSEILVAGLNENLAVQGNPRAIKAPPGRNVPQAWTSDSREILFINTVSSGTIGRLMRAAADGNSPAHGVALTGEGVTSAAVSAQGNRMSFSRSFGDYNVWSVSVTAPGKVEPPAVFLNSTRGEWVRPLAISPDGKRLVFESDRSGARYRMAVQYRWIAGRSDAARRSIHHRQPRVVARRKMDRLRHP